MRRCERGSAMLVVMIIVTVLIAGAVILTRVQASSTRGTDVSKTKLTGLYCAEAGLAEARATIIANVAAWDAFLGTGTEPGWLSPIDHDIDDDGTNDFVITLRDNDDEPVNDLAHDSDQTVFVDSTCTKSTETPTKITELLKSTGERKLWLRSE